MLYCTLLTTAACDPASAETPSPVFREIAQEVGLDFVHSNGHGPSYYYPAIMGSGVAVFDFDNDGDLDVYAVQGGALGHRGGSTGNESGGRLFRNDSSRSALGGMAVHFVDITVGSGIKTLGFGFGATTGDYDGDGATDLYLSNFGPNQLWRNLGDGTFEEVTAETGTDDPRWSVAACFLDYDLDGAVDLFVLNYLDFTVAAHRPCFTPTGEPDYCGPTAYDPVPDRLLRNRGDGTFEDVSVAIGITLHSTAGLGVSSADLNDDGWPDLYVASDLRPNRLWLNSAGRSFSDEALLAGVAVNGAGQTEASMGVAIADFDEDDDLDIFLTHLRSETNTLYVNEGNALFVDRTTESTLAAPSTLSTGFGTAWFDFDNDGWLDLYAANGEVQVNIAQLQAGATFPFAQPDQLFRNLGNGRFEDVSHLAGAAVTAPATSRGATFGDLENDGDTDVLVLDSGAPLRLLENLVGQRARWIGLRVLEGFGSDLPGATIDVLPESGHRRHRRLGSDGSYASALDPRLLVGLGASERAVTVELRHARAHTRVWRDLESGRYYVVAIETE